MTHYRRTRAGWVLLETGEIQHGTGIVHVDRSMVPYAYHASAAFSRHGPRVIFSSAASRRALRENFL